MMLLPVEILKDMVPQLHPFPSIGKTKKMGRLVVCSTQFSPYRVFSFW
jgi:hypothetical protein